MTHSSLLDAIVGLLLALAQPVAPAEPAKVPEAAIPLTATPATGLALPQLADLPEVVVPPTAAPVVSPTPRPRPASRGAACSVVRGVEGDAVLSEAVLTAGNAGISGLVLFAFERRENGSFIRERVGNTVDLAPGETTRSNSRRSGGGRGPDVSVTLPDGRVLPCQ
ncbi:MAG: hypothetical protein KDK12_18275 [Rhodobacteraceae bacterium]|nr:hypothetical protein [Paracoccaceae bacterium]